MTTKRSVLVTGATGQQGGAVAHALLSRGHRVKALTRKPDSDAARRLASAGAEVVAGDLGDAASVVKAASGVDTMFLMGNSYEAGMEAETRQGIIAADAAKAAGIGHLIYSSVADADKETGIPHFESKYLVEKHVAGLGIPYTISAPVAFMENIVAPWSIGALRQGTHAFAMPAQTCPPTGRPGGYRGFRRGFGRTARAGVRQAFRFRRRRVVRRGAGENPVASHRPPDHTIRKSRSPRLASKARMQRSCSNGSTASATMPTSPHCGGIFRRSAGTVSRTGRASSTGAFSNGRLPPPEFPARARRRKAPASRSTAQPPRRRRRGLSHRSARQARRITHNCLMTHKASASAGRGGASGRRLRRSLRMRPVCRR